MINFKSKRILPNTKETKFTSTENKLSRQLIVKNNKHRKESSLKTTFTSNGGKLNKIGIINTICNKLRLNFLDMDSICFEEEATKILSKEILYKYLVIPFKLEENILHIAMANSIRKEIIDDISAITKKEIKVYAVKEEQLLWYLNKINSDFQWNMDKNNNPKKEFSQKFDFNEAVVMINNISVMDWSNKILAEAIYKRASDIHFEPFEDFITVRIRVDGILYKIYNLEKSLYEGILSMIKIQSDMDISIKLMPQDGKIKFKIKDIDYDLRTSTIPTIYGEKLVLRILYKQCYAKIEELGFENHYNIIKNISNKNNGLILVTGPTGSGKTTTLHSLIQDMDKVSKNIITIEDPVEYKILGVNQININNRAGLTFPNILRSVLRQDPDVIMIGEIRDEETAEIATRAAITGHLVLSTIHTKDSISTLTRLLNMKIPPYILSEALSLIISQRLVRKICPYCKETYLETIKNFKELGFEEEIIQLHRGRGCEHCNNTGYMGRTVVYEILELKDIHKNLINSHADIKDFRETCNKSALIGFKENCILKLKEGTISFEEFKKIFY